MDSDEEENDYIVFGTPLPDIDDDTVVNKKAAQDLSVRDEKGRQRFHGAFTGGFSAGYFNSVGTKEGWEPSTFISSRSSKASSSSYQHNPEDFMDAEDFGEFGIAPKKVHATSNFRDESSFNVKKRKHELNTDSVIPGEAPLKDIIKPVSDSIGIAILKKMGWRQGQGIGPKEKKGVAPKIIGCSLGPLGPDKQNSLWDTILLAPDDTPEVPYVPKDDLHGIGYSGLSTHSVLNVAVSDEFSGSSTKSFLAKDKKKLSIRGHAFGVGALEDDDEDIYTKDDMSQYDFSELGGSAAHDKKSKEKTTDLELGLSSMSLEGFCRSKKAASSKQYFAPPSLPTGFQPKCKIRMSVQTLQKVDSSKTKLCPSIRSIMLGEKLLDSKKSEARKTRFDKGPDIPCEKPIPTPPKLLTNTTVSMPPRITVSSSKFKPFTKDEAKQQRYEAFLKNGCNKDILRAQQPSTLTEWEKTQEVDEFTMTATFYKPLAKELESRFESRSQLEVEIAPGLTNTKKNVKPSKSDKDPKVKLSSSIRETLEWHPVSLLCKRFNVPNPYPDSKDEGVMGFQKKKSSLFEHMSFALEPVKSFTSADAPEQIEQEQEDSIDITPEKTVKEPEKKEIASIIEDFVKEKPPMDLFTQIFCSSSSDDNDDDDDDNDIKLSATTSSIPTTAETSMVSPKTVPKDESASKAHPIQNQAFGVFANLDLDALNRRSTAAKRHITVETADGMDSQNSNSASSKMFGYGADEKLTQNNVLEMEKGNGSDNYYGPELPPSTVPVQNVSSDSCSHPKSVKQKHHKHKHKVKKKSKKHKKRKLYKREIESSESSIDSEEDVAPERIINKLKKLKNVRKF